MVGRYDRCLADFGSRNCLREVVATLDQGKQFLFVHETDPEKGGPVEELMKELKNADHRRRLFDEHPRRKTEWHRIKEVRMRLANPRLRARLRAVTTDSVSTPRVSQFQMVSLVHIAEDMLRQSPGFGKKLSLFIPGSLSEQKLVFKTRIVLYVSGHNSGAAEVVEDLCSQFQEMSVTHRLHAHPRQVMHKGGGGSGRGSGRGSRKGSVLAKILRMSDILRTRDVSRTNDAHDRHTITTLQSGSASATAGPAVHRSMIARLSGKKRLRVQASQMLAAAGASDETRAEATHFLLYLNEHTFADDDGALAKEVRTARTLGLPIVMIHENDRARHGCEFSTFFETTPKDLLAGGLYSALAIAFMPGSAHREVSQKLCAQSMGAEVAAHKGAFGRMSSARKRAIGRMSSAIARKSGRLTRAGTNERLTTVSPHLTAVSSSH